MGHTEKSVFRLKGNIDALGQIVRNYSGQTYSQVYNVAVFELHSTTTCYHFTNLIFVHMDLVYKVSKVGKIYKAVELWSMPTVIYFRGEPSPRQ